MGLETNLNFMRQRFSWRAQRACLPWPFLFGRPFLFGIYASKLPGRLAGRLCGVWWTDCLFGSVSEDTHKQGRPGERKRNSARSTLLSGPRAGLQSDLPSTVTVHTRMVYHICQLVQRCAASRAMWPHVTLGPPACAQPAWRAAHQKAKLATFQRRMLMNMAGSQLCDRVA